MAGDNHHHHADRQNQDVPVLNDQVGNVLRVQQDPVGEKREQHNHRDEGEENAVLAEVANDVANGVLQTTGSGDRAVGLCFCISH